VYLKTETLVGAFMCLALGLVVYMSFQLGSVRLNLARYATYTIGFKDVSNLLPKADIKIAGVKVGWVDAVYLNPKTMAVDVTVQVLKDYKMHTDASAVVRQEGLLGVKFLELIPGTRQTEIIPSDGTFPFQERPAVGIDEIFVSVNTLAKQIERLGTSLEESNQEARIILQSIRNRLDKIDNVFTDITRARESFEKTAQVVQQAGRQVSRLLPGGPVPGEPDSSKPVPGGPDSDESISEESSSEERSGAEGIRPSGQGVFKFLHDEQLYEDIKTTSEYARSCVERMRGFCVGLDSHLEVLPSSFGKKWDHRKTDVKWYFDLYLASCGGLFTKLGLAYSHKGFARRRGCVDNDDKRSSIYGHRDDLRLNLQVGKYCHPYGAFRVGIFEGTAGIGVDWWLTYNRFKWLTTFEAFDYRGHNRFVCDRRPHLKWINRVFFTNNVYLTFGADDFISRCNKSGFIGIGTYFSVPDLFGCR